MEARLNTINTPIKIQNDFYSSSTGKTLSYKNFEWIKVVIFWSGMGYRDIIVVPSPIEDNNYANTIKTNTSTTSVLLQNGDTYACCTASVNWQTGEVYFNIYSIGGIKLDDIIVRSIVWCINNNFN